jgi:hypothetical protein
MKEQSESRNVDENQARESSKVQPEKQLDVRVDHQAGRDDQLEHRVANLEIAARFNKWVVILTGITAVIAMCGVVISFMQWRTTRNLFVQDQRPYVVLHAEPILFEPGKPIMVNVFSGNLGKTPALRAGGTGQIFVGSNAMERAYRWFEGLAGDPGSLRRSETIIRPGAAPTDGVNAIRSTLRTSGFIVPDEFRAIEARDFSVVVAFRSVYEDIAGNQYWTDLCVGYLVSNAVAHCPKHNTAN